MYYSIEHYLQDITLAGLTPSTIHEYHTQLSHFARYCLARSVAHPTEITQAIIREYLVALKRERKQSTVYTRSLILRLFCRWLGLPPDTVPHVAIPHRGDARRLRLKPSEVQALINHIHDRFNEDHTAVRLRSLVVVVLLFGAGLRVGEIAKLRVKDVDIASNELRLIDTKTHIARMVALPPSVVPPVDMYLRWRMRQAVKSDKFLLSWRHAGVSAHTLAQEIKARGIEIGLDLSSHTGRRYCITRLAYTAGVYVAMQQAGHKNLQTTQAYLAESPEEVKRAVRENDPLKSYM